MSKIKTTQTALTILSIISITSSFIIKSGIGFNSNLNRIGTAKCFNNKLDRETCVASFSNIESKAAITREDLENRLETGFDLKVSFDVQAVGFSIGLDYKHLKERLSSKKGKSFYYTNVIEKIDTFSLEDFEIEAKYKDFFTNNIDYFLNVCGDMVIEKVRSIGSFIIEITIDEENKGKTDGNQGGFSVAVTNPGPEVASISLGFSIKKIVTETNYQGKIKVKAYQIGGDGRKLAKLMLNSMYDSECDSSSISKCVTVLDKFVDYATNQFPSQFTCSDHGNYSLITKNNVSAWGLESFYEFDTSKLKRKGNSFIEMKEK